MHIVVSTRVSADYREVWGRFDASLFRKLSPPFPPARLLRFDGSLKGNEVHIELNFILFRQQWISLIVESDIDNNEIYFVDEGIRLPFFLKYWQHRHRIIKLQGGTRIVDDIHFSTPYKVTDYLMYPFFYLMFVYRKPVYIRLFGRYK